MDSLLASTIEKFPQPVLGIVEETITFERRGRVKFDGTYWPARFYQADIHATAYPSELVAIIGMQGITLLVAPLDPEEWPESDSEAPASEETVTDSGNRLYWAKPLSRKRGSARVF